MEENKNEALEKTSGLFYVLMIGILSMATVLFSQGMYYDNAEARRTACWNFYQTQALAHPESRTSGQCAG